MTELPLFEAAHLARATDPPSSKRAARRLTTSGRHKSQKARVLRALRDYPGLTSKELALAMGEDRYMVARRLPDLERDGKVEKGSDHGDDVTWWPVEE